MNRNEIVEIWEREVLEPAARQIGTAKDVLEKFDDYEGCANLVYQITHSDQPRILRISCRSDQPMELIRAELQSELRQKIYCIENDIPRMCFFDSVFNPDQHFALEA